MNRTQNPTGTAADTDSPTAVVTPADILRGAAYYLETYGWNRRNYYAEGYQPFPPACVAGAIGIAAFGRCVDLAHLNYDPRLDAEERRDYRQAFDYLCDYLTGTEPAPWRFTTSEDERHVEVCPYLWNDHPDRLAAHVVLALNAAADDYDRTHRSPR